MDEYVNVTRSLLRKRQTDTDVSDELEYLMKADLQAREIIKNKEQKQVFRIQPLNYSDKGDSERGKGIRR